MLKFLFLLLSVQQLLFGAERMQFGKETLETLEVQGFLKLCETTISSSLQVTGALIAENAHIAAVDGVGDLQFFDTTVGEVHAVGALRASRSTFQKPLYFCGQRGVFVHCHLADLIVEREFGFKGAQVIELKEKSEVNGAIRFQGGNGKVFLYPGSRVLGEVTGGELVRKR
ncbi:MAG: hypothetical protein KGI80_02825 [Verrucomicrobiota bacterium]|nr:hypothetical protein [Verrucomicrobiota bacterium]